MATRKTSAGSLGVFIDHPTSAVFEFLSYPPNHAKWYPEKNWEAWLTSQPPVRAGSTFVARSRDGAVTKEYEGVVTAFEPPRVFAFSLRGPDRTVECGFRLEPRGGGTQLACESKLTLHSWRRPFSALLSGTLDRRLQQALRGIPTHVKPTGGARAA